MDSESDSKKRGRKPNGRKATSASSSDSSSDSNATVAEQFKARSSTRASGHARSSEESVMTLIVSNGGDDSGSRQKIRRSDTVAHSEPRSDLGSGSAKNFPGGTLLRSAFSLKSRLEPSDYETALRHSAAEIDGENQDPDAQKLQIHEGEGGLSVYVHLPFCPSRCLTCDHQTTVSHDHRQIDRYLDALALEVEMVADHLGGQRRRLQQLHLGGGTPNYLSDVQLVRLVDVLERYFMLDEHTETSLEANAHRASLSQLGLLHGLGFRHLNLEVRDLDPGVQRTTGRHQSLGVVGDVVESARHIGFDSVATDLIYGLPGQTSRSITRTIEQLTSLQPDRVSCYNYSRRADRFTHQRALDESLLPSLADKVSIFSRIVEGFCSRGYDWIGLDCFAKPEDRIAVAHASGTLHRNSIGYTHQPGRNVLGFGSSSVSDLSTICVQNHPGIEAWQDCLQRGELPVNSGTRLSPRLRARRNALSDLMCNLQLEDAGDLIFKGDGESDPEVFALSEDGFIEVDGNRITITEAGRYSLHQLWGDASPSYRWGQFA